MMDHQERQFFAKLNTLLLQLDDVSGENFFHQITSALMQMSGHVIDYAFIASADNDDQDVMTILSIQGHDGLLQNFRYDLNGTPCAKAMHDSHCFYPDNVADLYPEDKILQDMDIRGYTGIRLSDNNGKAIGVLGLLSHALLTEEAYLMCLLQIFGAKTANVLEKNIFDNRLELSSRTTQHALLELAQIKLALDEHATLAITTEDGILKYVNQRFCDQARYSRAELMGKPFAFLKPGHQDHETYSALQESIKTKSPWQGEIQYIDSRVGDIAFDTTCYPLKAADGSIEEVVFIMTDITDRIHKEKALAHALRASEEANRVKNNFLAVMSHEVRTPMNGILGMAQLLHQSDLNPEQEKNVSAILSSGWALLNLLNEVLDSSKLEAQNLRLENSPVDPVALLQEIENTLAPSARLKNLDFTVHVDQNIPVVMADPYRLRQVLLNLVGNAIKFTNEGQVLIFLRQQNADKPDITRLIIVIQDTGIGIPADQQTKIFERFYQIDDSTRRQYEGSGLGLAICKDLIDLMRGTIQVKSEEGMGTSFSLTLDLPLAKADDKEIPSQHAEQTAMNTPPVGDHAAVYNNGSQPLPQMAAGHMPTVEGNTDEDFTPVNSGHILLAEDNHINQLFVTTLLKKAGYSITTADNGQQVLDLLQAQPDSYHLILMDIQMPVLNGLDTTKVIRVQEAPYAEIPIIALTANSHKDDEDLYLKSGMDAYVPKPLQPEDLFNTIAKLLNRNAPYSAATN